MARTVVGPPRNTAYVAMLGLAVAGMVLSCAMLGLEVSGYDPVPAFQAVNLPKVEPRPAPPPAGTPGGAVPAPPAGGTAQVDPPAAPVAIAPPPLPAPPPAVAKVDPPKVEVPKPDDLKRGPRPGFNLTAPPATPQP